MPYVCIVGMGLEYTLYELSTGTIAIIPAFHWCMGCSELN